MATVIRPSISEKNKYYIDKHRYYELKHFCLQYPLWKKAHADCLNSEIPMALIDGAKQADGVYDPTSARALTRAHYSQRMELVERVARDADKYLWHLRRRTVPVKGR